MNNKHEIELNPLTYNWTCKCGESGFHTQSLDEHVTEAIVESNYAPNKEREHGDKENM